MTLTYLKGIEMTLVLQALQAARVKEEQGKLDEALNDVDEAIDHGLEAIDRLNAAWLALEDLWGGGEVLDRKEMIEDMRKLRAAAAKIVKNL
jgi:hypothetical protein